MPEYRQSGLTQEAFAKREGINYTTFCSWVPEAGKRPMKAVEFAQLQLPRVLNAEVSSLEVRFPDGTSVRGGDPEVLAVLVRALRR